MNEPSLPHATPTGPTGPWPQRVWAARPLLLVALLACLLAACSQRYEAHEGPGPVVGAFVPSGVWNDLAPLKALERRVGGTFELAHWYTSWDLPYDPEPVDDLLAHGRIPLVTWQSHNQALPDIAAGAYDAYLTTWAHAVSKAAGTVYVRIFPEMNGEWTPWSGDPAALKAAWSHVVELFRREGATNVRWVFTPNVTDEPRVPENAMELYYPGADYVDVLGLDGYNWGATRPYIGWRTFEQVFQEGYARITRLGSQPVWLAEVASAELGGDKGAWVDAMLRSTAFPRVEALVWFNEDKETDWRIESSVASLTAFRNYFEAIGSEAPDDDAPVPAAPVTASARSAALSGVSIQGR